MIKLSRRLQIKTQQNQSTFQRFKVPLNRDIVINIKSERQNALGGQKKVSKNINNFFNDLTNVNNNIMKLKKTSKIRNNGIIIDDLKESEKKLSNRIINDSLNKRNSQIQTSRKETQIMENQRDNIKIKERKSNIKDALKVSFLKNNERSSAMKNPPTMSNFYLSTNKVLSTGLNSNIDNQVENNLNNLRNSKRLIEPLNLLKKKRTNPLIQHHTHSRFPSCTTMTQNFPATTRIFITQRQKKPNKQMKMMKSLFKRTKIFTIIKDELLRSGKQIMEIFQLISSIVCLLEQMIEQVYSYNNMQALFQKLNNIVKDTMSRSLVFQCYALCGLCLYIYGSFSLSIFYFDKGLKKLAQIQKDSVTIQLKIKQIEIYKTTANIFLIQGDYKLAKQFAYKYLRKAWYSNKKEQELNAYDILGKIYHECQLKGMSLYFHNRMCKGELQQAQFVKLSNFQLEKYQKEQIEFAVYETIQVFVERDKIFHQMLEDRYRMRDHNYQKKETQHLKNHFFFHTHRSPNRNLNSYRILERKMIEQKKSKQLHFIKPKQAPYIKRLISDFIKLLNKVSEEIQEENQHCKDTDKLINQEKTNI